MRVKPLEPLMLATQDPNRSSGLHASDIYGALYQHLDPTRYKKDAPMDWTKIALGLAWERYLERLFFTQGVNAARPGEFHSPHGYVFSPDLFVFNGNFRIGEIKLTWMSSRGWPKEATNGLPPQFDKWLTQMKLYCVSPSSRLLTYDLRWVNASSLSVGDRLLGFDETGLANNRKRFWKPSTIRRIVRVLKPSYHLVFDDATEVTCSADHQWLAYPSPTANARWIRTDQLMIEDSTSYPGNKKFNARVSKPLDVWETVPSFTDGYLSGILDGEGYLSQQRSESGGSLIVGIAQLEGVVANNIRRILRHNNFEVRESLMPPTATQPRAAVRFTIGPFREVIRLLGLYRPSRLLEKWDNLRRWTAMTNTRTVGIARRVSIGLSEVVAIETTSHTFIVEGFASHNCHETETPYATLYPYFVNGNYRNGPQVLPLELEFSRRELKENHSLLLQYARNERLL